MRITLEVRVKKLTDTATIPTKANPHDAGYDLYSDENVICRTGETILVSTGIAIEIPDCYAGLIWYRSSLGTKGIHRFAGVVDSGYRGEVRVCLSNLAYGLHKWPFFHLPYSIEKGERIAQLIIQEVPSVELKEVDSLSSSVRGEGGFGSSGK